MVVNEHTDIRATTSDGQVDTESDRRVVTPRHLAPVGVDAHDVGGPDLQPAEFSRIDEHRPIGQTHGHMAGLDVVVVMLHEDPEQQRQLGLGGKLRERGRGESRSRCVVDAIGGVMGASPFPDSAPAGPADALII